MNIPKASMVWYGKENDLRRISSAEAGDLDRRHIRVQNVGYVSMINDFRREAFLSAMMNDNNDQ